MKKIAKPDQAVKDVMREERSRGRSRRPKDTEFEKQQREVEQVWLEVLTECASKQAVTKLLIAAGLQEGTERFQAAIDAWSEIQRRGA